MTHLDKLVAHTVWANGEWITFAAKNFPADDFVLVRLRQNFWTRRHSTDRHRFRAHSASPRMCLSV